MPEQQQADRPRASIGRSRPQHQDAGPFRSGFIPAAATFVAVFAAGSTPIPLYETYRAEDGVTATGLSVVAVVYFVSAVSALLVLGRLSDHLGRKPVGIAAAALAILGCLVLCTVSGPAPLLVGRALQGLATGLASSSVAAYVVDTAPSRPRWLVTTVTSGGTNVGLALGALGAGVLVAHAPAPRVLTYLIVSGVLAVCGAAIAISPETVTRVGGVVRSLRPRLSLPAPARPYAVAAAGIFISTWAFGGYYQAFGPTVAVTDLHSRSPIVAAAVFASYMFPSVVGGPIAGRFRPAGAQRLGMVLVVGAAIGLVAAIPIASAPLFIVAGVVAGVGMGTAFSGSLNALLPEAAPKERAGLLALVYATSYLGAAVPSLIAGQLARSTSLLAITVGYGALAVIALVVTVITARDPRPSTAG